MNSLRALLVLLAVCSFVYLLWVLIAWALIFIATAFGAVVSVSPWILAMPLYIVAGLFTTLGLK